MSHNGFYLHKPNFPLAGAFLLKGKITVLKTNEHVNVESAFKIRRANKP